jgi:hypothetical protein
MTSASAGAIAEAEQCLSRVGSSRPSVRFVATVERLGRTDEIRRYGATGGVIDALRTRSGRTFPHFDEGQRGTYITEAQAVATTRTSRPASAPG